MRALYCYLYGTYKAWLLKSQKDACRHDGRRCASCPKLAWKDIEEESDA